MKIEIGTLTPEEFISLCKSVGWGSDRIYDMNKVAQALKGTAFTVKIINSQGQVMGCGRAFSDDLFMTFIPDIFVNPLFQKQGVGKLIMETIKEKYGHTIFYFGAQPGKEAFYEGLGFEKGMQAYTGVFKKSPYYE